MNITKDYYRCDILYKCDDCGTIFTDDEKITWEFIREQDQDEDTLVSEECCPYCGSGEFYPYDEETDTD